MADQPDTNHKAIHEGLPSKEPIRKLTVPERVNMRSEKQAEGTEDTYRLLLENLNEVVYALDDKGVITYISPSIERLSSYRPGELIGKPYLDFVCPEDIQGRFEQFKKILAGIEEPSEYRFLLKDGTPLDTNQCEGYI